MRRVLLIGGAAALIVVSLVVWRLVASLDSIVAEAIERYGSEILGVPVRVASVELALTEGRGSIYGLRVGNPPGYAAGDAFRLAEVTLEIDAASVTESPVVLPQIRVIGPEVSLELDAKGGSNLQTLQRNVQRAAGSGAPDAEAEGGGGGDAGEPVRLLIRRFVFEAGVLRGDAAALSGREEDRFEAELAELSLSDIGGAKGATPSEVGETVMRAFLRQSLKTAAASQARHQLEKRLGDVVGEKSGKLIDGLF